jgi:hypothetical protein
MYDIEPMDKTLKAPTDGGYEFRRNRTTRPERQVITTGFIMCPHEDYEILRAFYEAHTKVVAFTYFDYIHGVTRQVRFDEWQPKYMGVGQNRMWTITIKMSEI